jgi:hypothetical protein
MPAMTIIIIWLRVMHNSEKYPQGGKGEVTLDACGLGWTWLPAATEFNTYRPHNSPETTIAFQFLANDWSGSILCQQHIWVNSFHIWRDKGIDLGLLQVAFPREISTTYLCPFLSPEGHTWWFHFHSILAFFHKRLRSKLCVLGILHCYGKIF